MLQIEVLLRDIREREELFWRLARNVVEATDDEDIWRAVSVTISGTPGAITGSLAVHHEANIDRLKAWLESGESRLKRFARREIEKERRQAKYEREQDALDEW